MARRKLGYYCLGSDIAVLRRRGARNSGSGPDPLEASSDYLETPTGHLAQETLDGLEEAMAIVFLQAINATLKRVRIVQGDAGELATDTTSTATGAVATGAFTDSGRQTQIDLVLQVWQEAAHVLFDLALLPNEAATATVDLVTAQREYSMPSNFERIAGESREERVFRGATTFLILTEYPGGYARMLRDQPNATDFTGDPQHWAISPVDGTKIRFDREPTSDQNGDSYNILYEKRIAITATMATETLPFSDTVADALVPVVAEGWNRIQKKEFDSGLFRTSIARAARTVTRNQPRVRYGFRSG
ncbi:MAG TPA: hypothetical protein ENH62_01140 [Marinobacter sp.]|nr:hypothetical protein [Marinobacter sp.]